MTIVSTTFVRSTTQPDQYPADGRPEFAFVGRSNVGKSTLLNTLLNKKGLAKTSSTPGKTQTINFFNINDRFYFVDLPGYGYAKVPRAIRSQWGGFLTDYLSARGPLRLVVHLIDSRHEPTEKDLDMLALLGKAAVPTLVVATKIDKLKRSERARNLAAIRRTLGLGEDALVVPFSGVTGEGVRDIWSVIENLLKKNVLTG